MPSVQEAITRLGCRVTYGEAQDELERMWGVTLSKSSIRKRTMAHGQVAQQLMAEKTKRLHEGEEMPNEGEPPNKLVMSVDGAMILTTTGDWREVKTVAFGEFDTTYDQKKKKIRVKTEQISYFSRLEEATQFGQSAVYEWCRRRGAEAKSVVTVNDGATWIQTFIDYHSPQATRVLDVAHAKGYIADVGKAIYGAESEQFSQWYTKMTKQLITKPPDRTLNDLRFLKKQQLNHPQFAEIELAVRYLERRKEMIDYRHFSLKGIPIGSGIVESAHRVVMHRRMKQAGMRWAEKNINPMLTLRNALTNRRWTETWADIQRRSASRRAIAPPPQPDAIQVVDQETISQSDIENLQTLAQVIGPPPKKQPWKDHRFIFPERYSS